MDQSEAPQCTARSPHDGQQCQRDAGHPDSHTVWAEAHNGIFWPAQSDWDNVEAPAPA